MQKQKVHVPSEAIIAVTLNCNARCVMCNIWQNKIKNEVPPTLYRRLPSTLKEINITGGEPFLRNDLPEIIQVMKQTCPQARLLINTNGYLTKQIQKMAPLILRIDHRIALRVSLDGWGKQHDLIRRLPHFFDHAIETLSYCKKIGIKDLGVSFTLMEQNKSKLLKLYTYCKNNNLEFSLTAATDSPIYFGSQKQSLRPKNTLAFIRITKELLKKQRLSFSPKEQFRAWFNKQLFTYLTTHKRPFPCRAGTDFFYLDSLGRIYTCHIKPWLAGDLTKQTFSQIMKGTKMKKYLNQVRSCNDCWMVCSARSTIKHNWLIVLKEIAVDFFKKK